MDAIAQIVGNAVRTGLEDLPATTVMAARRTVRDTRGVLVAGPRAG